MKSLQRHIRFCVLVLLLGIVFQRTAEAQAVHTLEIRNGAVFVDGAQVAAEQLPPSFRPYGVSAYFTYQFPDSVEAKALLELNGKIFGFDGTNIREMSVLDAQQAERPFLMRGRTGIVATGAGVETNGFLSESYPSQATVASPMDSGLDATLNVQNDVMSSFLPRVDDLRSNEGMNPFLFGTGEMERFPLDGFDGFSASAQMMYQMAAEYPRMEARRYLTDVQKRNAQLYERLVEEINLERETSDLALQIRSLGNQPDKSERLSVLLREKVERLFDLKQENRVREIRQLEFKLNELNSRLKERESNRDRIVDQRVSELVGGVAPQR